MVPKADYLADSKDARKLGVLGHLKCIYLVDMALGFGLKTPCYFH